MGAGLAFRLMIASGFIPVGYSRAVFVEGGASAQ